MLDIVLNVLFFIMLRKQHCISHPQNVVIANGWTSIQPIAAGINKLFCKTFLFSCITLTKNLSAVLRTCPHKWWVRHFIIFPFNNQTFCHLANSVTHFSKARFSTAVIYRIATIRATGCTNTPSPKCLWVHSFYSISFRVRQLWVWILALQFTNCGFGSQLHQFSYLKFGSRLFNVQGVIRIK